MCDGYEMDQKYFSYTVTKPTKEDLLLDSLCIPTQTQIRQQLGSKLAEVFFENLSSEKRVFLGLVPSLSGPDKVWVSPSSRLNNNITSKLVPELQVLHLKALTHKDVLVLGQEYIDILKVNSERQIEDALKQQALKLEEECKIKIKEALENAKIEADEHYSQVIGTLMEHFDKCFREVVIALKLRLKKECQLRIQEERSELAAAMFNQFEDQVQKHNLRLCSDFHNTHHMSAIATKLVQQVDAKRGVAQDIITGNTEKYETNLVDLKSEMEIGEVRRNKCEAITEMETRLEQESLDTSSDLNNRIILLLKTIASLEQRNKTLHEMAIEYAKRVKHYKNKMALLMKEFQKFISLELKADAAHAEFLFSIQKMNLSDYFENKLPDTECCESFENYIVEKMPVEEVDGVNDEKVRKSPAMKPKKKMKKEDSRETRKMEKDCKYTFDYYEFKYNLLKNLIKDVELKGKKKCVIEKSWHKKKKKVEGLREEKKHNDMKKYANKATEDFDELKQSLRVASENARKHMKFMNSFLQDRMRAIANICQDDPELMKMMLGCQTKERPPETST